MAKTNEIEKKEKPTKATKPDKPAKPAKAAAVKKEKSPKKKSPATRKKVVEDIPSDEAPADIRGRKRAGKPSNEERAKTSNIDEKVALVCADWLDDIRKERKNIPITAKIKALPGMLSHLVREDDVDDESDVTLILLADRYLGAQKTFHDAEEQSRREAQAAIHHDEEQSTKSKRKDDQ